MRRRFTSGGKVIIELEVLFPADHQLLSQLMKLAGPTHSGQGVKVITRTDRERRCELN